MEMEYWQKKMSRVVQKDEMTTQCVSNEAPFLICLSTQTHTAIDG